MNITEANIENLIPYVNNPRINENAVDKVASSINEFGFKVPIIVDKNNVIVAGHTRLLAAKKLGLKTVPITIADDLTNAQVKAFRIADNKVSEYADWDKDLLKIELEQLEEMNFNIDDLDLDFNDLDLDLDLEEDEGNIEDEEELEICEEAFTQNKDIWVLGKHKVMCGDSYNANDLKMLMQDVKAQIVFTDPPYDLENEDYYLNIENFSKDAHIFVMHDDRGIVQYLRNSNLDFKRFFVANFVFCSPRGNDPYLKHILVSHEHNGNPIIHKNLHDGFASIINMEYRGTLKDEKTEHKHQKSIKFIQKFLEHYSEEGFICLDIFAGSGSTLISCDLLNRINYSMELDEKYVDLIVRRYIKHKSNNFDDIYLIRNGVKIPFKDIHNFNL